MGWPHANWQLEKVPDLHLLPNNVELFGKTGDQSHTVAHLGHLRVNTDFPISGSISWSCLIYLYKIFSLIPFCQQHSFHTRGWPYVSVSHSLASEDLSAGRFVGQNHPGCKRGQTWTLLSALAPELLGKANLPSSSLVLTGWCGLCYARHWTRWLQRSFPS